VNIKGDFKFKANTIPIKLGVKKTKNILVYLQIVFIVGCLILIFIHNKINFLNYTSFFSIYILITVLLPSIYILFLMKKADIKKDFTLISFLLKLIMILGILSMVFWKLNIF
jgi:4-hydroxybenzoate polyprenyltransferase